MTWGPDLRGALEGGEGVSRAMMAPDGLDVQDEYRRQPISSAYGSTAASIPGGALRGAELHPGRGARAHRSARPLAADPSPGGGGGSCARRADHAQGGDH